MRFKTTFIWCFVLVLTIDFLFAQQPDEKRVVASLLRTLKPIPDEVSLRSSCTVCFLNRSLTPR